MDRTNRIAKRDEKLRLEGLREEQLLREKTLKKANQAKMSQQKGKKDVFRSQPPRIKKNEEERPETPQDERDYRKYIVNL